MHHASQTITKPEPVRATIDRCIRQRPPFGDILRAFLPLLETREHLAETFAAQSLDISGLDMSRLQNGNQGLPLLAGASVEFLGPWIKASAESILPVCRDALPDPKPMAALAEALESQGLALMQCCTLFMERDDTTLARIGEDAGVDPALLHFVTGQILAAPVNALARRVTEQAPELIWSQGYCPVCGSFPSIACLARAEPTELDALVGGGGQKYLHCSLCDNEWRFRRDGCPACDNADPGSREILHAHKAKQERVEVCTKCKAYLPCIDLREYAEDPNLTAAPLGLMHLDVVARERGFLPLAPAPWNSF